VHEPELQFFRVRQEACGGATRQGGREQGANVTGLSGWYNSQDFAYNSPQSPQYRSRLPAISSAMDFVKLEPLMCRCESIEKTLLSPQCVWVGVGRSV
jgi:hypothetical protein